MNTIPILQMSEQYTLIGRMGVDPRIGPIHQSLFIALFFQWQLAGFSTSFPVTRKILMSMGKIASTATYHKCMKELCEFGYIQYRPSNHPKMGSMVSWLK